jgi:hypothetical protein
MNILLGIEFVLIVGAVIVAILSAMRPAPILWIAVILLAIAQGIGHAGSGVLH